MELLNFQDELLRDTREVLTEERDTRRDTLEPRDTCEILAEERDTRQDTQWQRDTRETLVNGRDTLELRVTCEILV